MTAVCEFVGCILKELIEGLILASYWQIHPHAQINLISYWWANIRNEKHIIFNLQIQMTTTQIIIIWVHVEVH